MPESPERVCSTNDAPTISADFLTGSAEIGLDRIRTRLLDLTNRNKLLNYRYPAASCVRVVDGSLDEVYLRLRDNEKAVFAAVPEPDCDPDDRPSAKEHADDIGWNTSFDLDVLPERKDSSRTLRALHYPEHLDTLSRQIGSAAKTAIEESGTNMLHLVFGFLEWYEADDSKQPHFAPLVTLPVTLERSDGRGKAIDSVLDYSGEDVGTNLSLVEKMRRDFSLEMPFLDDDDTPELYFSRFEQILNVKKRWRIRRQMTLALLSFGKLLMYRDLDPKNWPAAQSISKHVLVRGLFEGTKNPTVALAEEYSIDAPELKQQISTTYGPDARGNQFQRFGPINGANGHRRLNVLFTRAKKRTVVYSSLDPDRIQTTPNSPWGLRALKQYLVFARTGNLQQPDQGGSQSDNDFERSVGYVLREKGYDVVPQVGVAGFFIDLGVRHPSKPGAFLLGIECDGATYHSGKSARDRDRLRQEILENLGWKLHRVWSTDWFRSRDSEIKRLLDRIEDLLKKDPADLAEKSTTQLSDSLRKRLIDLRESEIKLAFPDSPLEVGLLRKTLLDEFLETRPKTREEWFKKIPHHLRVSVDSKQIAKYLDRVLEIIASCGA